MTQFAKPAGIYLLSHSVGLAPTNVSAYAEDAFFSTWKDQPEPWNNWLGGIEKFKAALASLLNANATEFCPQTNLSSALTKILSALPPGNGKKILLTENDFPSIGFVLEKAKPSGYELQYIPGDANALDVNVWADYLTADVGVVLVTHVQSNTGLQTPAAEITKLARERDILSVVDIAQSCGVIPIDLAAWSADFVLGSCVKWLCGGPGAGYLWITPERIGQLEPTDVGWFSHAQPFEFDIHHFEYAEDASRFWGGTPSVLPYVVATNSINLITSIGVDNIRQHNLALTQSLIDTVAPETLRSPQNSEQRSGTLILHFDNQHDKVVAALKKSNVHFDARVLGIRLSPHIYNTQAEIDTVITQIHNV